MADQLNKLKIALQMSDGKYDDLLQLYLDDATDFLKTKIISFCIT